MDIKQAAATALTTLNKYDTAQAMYLTNSSELPYFKWMMEYNNKMYITESMKEKKEFTKHI